MWAALKGIINQTIAVLGLMTFLIGYFAPILHIDIPPNTLIALGNVAFLIGALLMIVAERKAREALQVQLQPRLAILYKPGEHYEHIQAFVSSAILRKFSVGIQNDGNQTIDEVRVYLKQLRPLLELSTGHAPDLPEELGLIHEDASQRTVRPTKTISHSQEIDYFAIVSKWEGPGPSSDYITMWYGMRNMPTRLSCRRYEFSIEAVGRNVAPTSRRFVIDIDTGGHLTFGPQMD